MRDLVVQELPSGLAEARRVAARRGAAAHEIAVHTFPDGEIKVRVAPPSSTTLVYASLDRPNDKLIALLFAAEAMRRGGARRLVLIAPYLGYMRQDAAFAPGEAISQRVVGRLIADALDRVVTVDAHPHRVADLAAVFPGIETRNLSAMPAIAEALAAEGYDPATVVVGPDVESRPWIDDLAARLALPAAVATKERHGDRRVAIRLDAAVPVAGRPVLLVDDIVASGGTLTACARALAAAGATRIDAIVTHALFPVDLMAEFARAGIGSVRSTTSVPHPTNAIALDALLAAALVGEAQPRIVMERAPWP